MAKKIESKELEKEKLNEFEKRELNKFKKNLEKTLEKISQNTNIGMTNADRKFIQMHRIAIEKSTKYGDKKFMNAYKCAVLTYNEIIDFRIEYVSTIRKMGSNIRIDNSKACKITTDEIVNKQKDKKLE